MRVNGRTLGLPNHGRRARRVTAESTCSPGMSDGSGGWKVNATSPASSMPVRAASTGEFPVFSTRRPAVASFPPLMLAGSSRRVRVGSAGTVSSMATTSVSAGGVSSTTWMLRWRTPAGMPFGRVTVTIATPEASGNSERLSWSIVAHCGSTPSTRSSCPLMTSRVLVTVTVISDGRPGTAEKRSGVASTRTAQLLATRTMLRVGLPPGARGTSAVWLT